MEDKHLRNVLYFRIYSPSENLQEEVSSVGLEGLSPLPQKTTPLKTFPP